ncbi:MAG: phosphatase PAP2 family protein [Firmicutes bacterium]|nr:phosphatase PAP2 family protein [Bacillota bacterium]
MEIGILLWFQEVVRQPWLTPIMEFISFLGKAGWFFIAITLVLCCFKKTRKIGIVLALGIILQFLIGNIILKPIVARARPYETYADVLHLIGKKENDLSFPSGHTGVAFVWAVCVCLTCDKKWGILAIALGLLMGISRMYLGFHYPTDVLGAILLGIVNGYVAYVLAKKYIYPRMKE